MWYDLLTLIILMYAMFRGAMKGIVWQLATIAALLLCFFFSGSLSSVLAPFIRVEPPLNGWIAMLVLYLGFSFVCYGVARVLHEAIESMRIEALDRHMGAILGLVKGAMFSIFLTFFLVTLSHSARESIINSESGYVAAVVIDRLDPVIPGDLHALLEPYLRRLDAPEIEREHLDERYARDRDRRGDRDDPFVEGDDRGQHDDLDRRGLDDRRGVDDRRSVDDRRGVDDRRLADDHRRTDDLAPSDEKLKDDGRYGTDRRVGEPPRDAVRDRRREVGDTPFDDVASGPLQTRGGPALDSPAVGGRSNVADDFGNDPRADRRRERRRDDDRVADDDLGTPSRDESDWLSSLPALVDQEVRQLARKAWRATKPEHRGELSRRLSSTTIPEMIRKTLRDWQNGRPAAAAGDNGDERAALERQILRSLDAVGSDRRMAIEDMEASLNGIPDDVALSVLRGWRDDLRDQKSDRDPREIDGSSLVRRIRRELSRAGISVRTLDSATQERLRGGELR
jgi:uncharacterized membrane protein required for colicin V production